MAAHLEETHVLGGVDTHKELHVAAVVDHRDRVLGTETFPTTRHGYRLKLAWMRSFVNLRRVGDECSGSYGAGLLRFMQAAGVEILEVGQEPGGSVHAVSIRQTVPRATTADAEGRF